jgi:inner membrane protein YhjD
MSGSPEGRAPGASAKRIGLVARVRAAVESADRAARRHRLIAVPIATFKKFGDDRGGHWAALLAYYGFLSLFPLLLVFATILAFVVQGDEELQARILDSALAQFPIIGDHIRENLGALRGSALALAIGIAGSLWAGMGIVLKLQEAMDDLWDVPKRDRAGYLPRRLRALIALVGLGVAAVLSAGITAVAAMADGVGWLRLPVLAGTFALQALVAAAAYRYLTVADVRWRDVLPGAAVAAAGWMALLSIGSWLVDRQLSGASQLYGFFAIVLGLLSWIYLGAQLLLLSAELNVVLARRLWPRSLAPPPLTEPDRTVLAAQAREEAARPAQDVHVHFDDSADEPA